MNTEKSWSVLIGDVRVRLRDVPDESVHCVVTSPPYFSQRDYGMPEQIGLEKTSAEYVAQLVAVFREVKRVLRHDGTLWLNLGDKYASQGGARSYGSSDGAVRRADAPERRAPTLPRKNLYGIPWRVAFALQDDGWLLRQDIIWHKSDAMPESVTDRCSSAHEYVFLLARGFDYFFDADAIAEPASGTSGGACFGKQQHDAAGSGAQSRRYDRPEYETRNKRSVWTMPTSKFGGAHFATFPPALVEPCVRAGTSERGCCAGCGEPIRSGGVKRWCTCGSEDVAPSVVLDPFGGSGTVAAVCDLLGGRRTILCELNPEYAAMIPERVRDVRDAAFGRTKQRAVPPMPGQKDLF
jgi:site-specific DNA-methyltransferase (adenine-specific)